MIGRFDILTRIQFGFLNITIWGIVTTSWHCLKIFFILSVLLLYCCFMHCIVFKPKFWKFFMSLNECISKEYFIVILIKTILILNVQT